MRADGGQLAVDGVGGAGDGGRKADAILGAVDVVIHGLGHCNDLHPQLVQAVGEAEGVIASDGDQRVDTQALQIGQNLRRCFGWATEAACSILFSVGAIAASGVLRGCGPASASRILTPATKR